MQASSASSPVWPNGRMAEIVAERDRLGEIVVEPERAGERARDLRDLDRMGEPGAEMVALVMDEHLGLVGEPAEGGGMDDAVAVALERVRVGEARLGDAGGRARPRGRRRRARFAEAAAPWMSRSARSRAAGPSHCASPRGRPPDRSLKLGADRRLVIDSFPEGNMSDIDQALAVTDDLPLSISAERGAPARQGARRRAGRGLAHLGQGRRLLGLPICLRHREGARRRRSRRRRATARSWSSIPSRSK